MKRPYMTTDYHDLSYLEGKELIIIRGWKEYFETIPEKVVFLKDYPETILIELTFTKASYLSTKMPRSYKRMLPKSALAVSDYLIRVKDTGTYLTGEKVTRINRNAEPYKLEGIKIWE